MLRNTRLYVCLVLAISVGALLQSSAVGAARAFVVPALASITPAAANPGQTVTVLLQGTDLEMGSTSLAISGTGITVSNVQVVNTTSMVATFAVTATASSGARDVSVTTTGGTSGNLTFTVNALAIPTITAITPPNGNRGQVVNITLTGTNFVVGNTIVSVPGVGVSNVNVASSTSLTATLTIGPGATIQNSTVSVTTPAGTGSGTIVFATFNVPTLTSLSTNTAFAGSTLSINYNGTNFTAFGATTVAVSGTGVTVNSVANTTGTAQRAVSLTIDPTATPGPRTTTVTTPGGTTAALTLNIVKSVGYISSTIGGKVIAEGGAATAQTLPQVRDVARDSSGNLYLAIPGTFKLYKVTPGGVISTFAGTGVPGTLGDGGPALNAQFLGITSVAVDSSDNVYVTNLNEVRKIGTNGIITLYAGKGSTSQFAQQIVAGFGGDGGPALYATFSNPSGLVFDAAGNLYVTDNGNRRIRKITPAGIVSTVAGNGTAGFIGDGGLATLEQLDLNPETTKVAVDALGNIYIPETGNHRIRKVAAADGIITTITGTGNPSFSGDGGSALTAELERPTGVAIDSSGNLFISDSENIRIRKIGTDGNINTVAGDGSFLFNGDGPDATLLAVSFPGGLTVDPSGNVYFTDANRVRKLGTDGSLATVAGDTGVFSGDGGVATQARFYFPSGITADSSGGILIADAAFGRIRRIAPGTNIISTIAGSGSLTTSGDGGPPLLAGLGVPYDAAVGADGAIYITASNLEVFGADSRIWKIASNGSTITTIAGGPTSGYSGDGGLAISAELNFPTGITVDSAGNVYFSDSDNARVRKINASNGIISTFAGNGTPGYSGDGGPATSAQLSEPRSLEFDGSGNLYITDGNNGRIRKVAPDGTISTFSTITNATAVAVGGGAVFVTNGQTVTRFVDAGGSGQIAGFGPAGVSGDGGPARMSSIRVTDLAVTPSGAIVFVDDENQLVRQLTPAPTGSAVLSSFFGGIYYRTGNFSTLTVAAAVNLDGDGTFPWSATSSVTTPPSGTWLSLSSASGTGSGSMTVTIDPAGLSPGNYQGTITITAPGAVNGPITLPVTLTVMPPSLITVSAPSLTFAGTANGFPTSISNLSVGNPNTSDLAVTLAPSVITPMGGTWFTALSTTAATVVAGSPVTAVPTVNLAGLAAGTYTGAITITAAGAANSPLVVPVTLNVTAAASPTLSGVAPINGSQGQTISVTLTGTNFVNGATLNVSGTGITVGTVTVTSATSLTATLTIASNATASPRTISVTTANGTSGNQSFTVLGPPTLTSLVPNSAGPGRTISVALNGTNFTQNSTVAAIAGTGVTFTPLTPNVVNASTTSRTITLTIAPDATPGAHNVTVTTPQGTSSAVSFFVTAPADTLISTYAGQSVVTEGGLAINQPMSLMSDAAMDSFGNLYIAATHANKIFKVNSGGVITTFAGTGTAGSAGDGGLAINAQLFFPGSVLVDSGNNVLIADSSNNRVRKVAADGTITTIAGTGTGGFFGDGGPANLAQLNFPTAMALDPSGNLYVYDLNNRRLRKVSTTGIITTIAGSGTQGFFGDGLNGLLAQFSVDRQAMRLAADAAGNVYIPDTSNHRIRKVASDGTVSTIAGTGTFGFSGDNGPATSAQLNAPRGLAFDSGGNLYVSDANNNRIRKITAGGTISTIVGSGGYGFNGDGATPLSRQLSNPMGLFVDASGNVFFSDQGSNRIRVFSAAGVLTTVAGNGGGFAGDGGAVGSSTLYQPNAIAFDTSGNLFIADGRNYRIRKVDAGTGNISTIAGTGTSGNSADGTLATAAQIGYVNDMIVDASGNIYITTSQRVRKITVVSGVVGAINTIAGTGVAGFSGDAGLATAAQLNNPSGLAVDSSGNVYISDNSNHRVRKVNASDSKINTIAGTGTSGALGDGGAATAAQLNAPIKLALDTAGNLYIADSGNGRIRKVAASNQFISTYSTAGGTAVTFSNGNIYLATSSLITEILSDGSTITLGGFSSQGFSGDGGPSLMASINVSGLAVSSAGVVYFADQPNSIIRKLTSVASGSAVLSIAPVGIHSRLGSNASANTTVTVSLNGTGTFTWTATPAEATAPSAQWLTVSVPSGSGGAQTTVTVNAAGLAPGYYQGSVTFASPQSANGNVVLPITLTVLPSILASSVTSLTPSGTSGGANPGSTGITISQGGSGAPLAFTASSTTNAGGAWLSVTPTSATTSATVTASYNIAGLAAGVYTGSVVITSASAANSPLVVPVTLSLTATVAPTLSAITPANGAPGQILTAVITGTNFAPTGNTVSVSGTTGITVGTVAVLSPTQLGVMFTVASGAATGDRIVTVNNGIGTSNGVTFAVAVSSGRRRGQITSQ